MITNRKKLSVSILKPLIARMEREAAKKKWDLDLLVEEAILAYLEAEKPVGKRHIPKSTVPYTKKHMKKTIAQRAKDAITTVKNIKKVDPLNLSKISGKKPKAGKVRVVSTKVTSTLPMKNGKPVARVYTKKVAKL